MQLLHIENKIYEVHGQKVMLDFNLAELYETETRLLKRAVTRNIERFPEDFMFQLTKDEFKDIPNWDILPQRFSNTTPLAFTEHGVTMLASVLRSPKAIQVNIAIVKAFVALRQFAINFKEIADKLKQLETKYDKQFKDVYDALDYLVDEKKEADDYQSRKRIGFKAKK